MRSKIDRLFSGIGVALAIVVIIVGLAYVVTGSLLLAERLILGS